MKMLGRKLKAGSKPTERSERGRVPVLPFLLIGILGVLSFSVTDVRGQGSPDFVAVPITADAISTNTPVKGTPLDEGSNNFYSPHSRTTHDPGTGNWDTRWDDEKDRECPFANANKVPNDPDTGCGFGDALSIAGWTVRNNSNVCPDEQVEDITRRWTDFYESHPDAVIMVEGNYDQLSVEDTQDRDTAISNFGEHGLMVHLARQSGVEVLSPEPNGADLEARLISEFGKDQVVLQRTLAHITEVGKKMLDGQALDMEQEISEFLAQYTRESIDGRFAPYGIQDIEDIYRDLFPDGTMKFAPAQYDTDLPDSYINEIDPVFAEKIDGNPYLVKVFDIAVAAYNLFNPEQDQCIINEITRRADDLRNIHIAQQVQFQWSQGKSIFAVYGWAHAAQLEPALKALIKA